MPVHPYFHDEAGEWVAYRDEPVIVLNSETGEHEAVPGETRRVYLAEAYTGVTVDGSPERCDRFDTKPEATEAAKKRWPLRTKGCRIGAEKVGRPVDGG